MGKFKFFLSDEVKDPQGHGFYVRTMDTCRHFYPFWDVLEYMMKHSPGGRIKPFHGFVFRACDENNPIVCMENDNKGNAIKAHENLRKMLEKGYNGTLESLDEGC